MDGLLFLAVLIGTTWLCIWFLQGESQSKSPWSPFEARHIGELPEAPTKSVAGRAPPPPRPWRRSDAQRALRPTPEPPPWRRRSSGRG